MANAKSQASALATKMTKAKVGQRILDVVTAERINAIQDAIRALAQQADALKPVSEPSRRRYYSPFQPIHHGIPYGETAKMKMEIAWGSVTPVDDVRDDFDFTFRDSYFTIGETEKIWLDFSFDVDGAILTGEMVSGVPGLPTGWGEFPKRYKFEGSSTWNHWYHPIAEVRVAKTGKASRSGNDPGEYEDMPGNLVVAQLTNTHLVVQGLCIDGFKIWSLTPGPGAISP